MGIDFCMRNPIIAFIKAKFEYFLIFSFLMFSNFKNPSSISFALVVPASSGVFGVNHEIPSKKAIFAMEVSVNNPSFSMMISSFPKRSS